MEFTKYKCPVCNEAFKSGDDIVVCPECGAPHHRSCYEEENRCCFEDKHSNDFSFEEISNEFENRAEQSDDAETIICPNCNTENPNSLIFCKSCGYELRRKEAETGTNHTQNNPNQGIPPFGFSAAGIPDFDPLAGLNPEEEIAEGIKTSEMAKFVGKNTQYFLLVFNRIKQFRRSKFNFAAFLFSGIYFLYRKMYGVGILFTLLLIASEVLSTYLMLTPEYLQAYQEVFNFIGGGFAAATTQELMSMSGKMLIIYLPMMINMVRYALMLISGFKANRWYHNHCTKKIREIKSAGENPDVNQKLESSGGVNMALAVSFGIAAIVISYICYFWTLQGSL